MIARLAVAAFAAFALLACDNPAGMENNGPGGGEILGKTEASAVLTGTARWCFEGPSNADISTVVFIPDGHGQLAMYSRAKKKLEIPVAMQWLIDDNVLVISTFNKKIIWGELRFDRSKGSERVTLYDKDGSAYMSPCSF